MLHELFKLSGYESPVEAVLLLLRLVWKDSGDLNIRRKDTVVLSIVLEGKTNISIVHSLLDLLRRKDPLFSKPPPDLVVIGVIQQHSLLVFKVDIVGFEKLVSFDQLVSGNIMAVEGYNHFDTIFLMHCEDMAVDLNLKGDVVILDLQEEIAPEFRVKLKEKLLRLLQPIIPTGNTSRRNDNIFFW